jgi:hypothetical protein
MVGLADKWEEDINGFQGVSIEVYGRTKHFQNGLNQ